MAEYYGMNSDNTIDREQLVAALKYMKESTNTGCMQLCKIYSHFIST